MFYLYRKKKRKFLSLLEFESEYMETYTYMNLHNLFFYGIENIYIVRWGNERLK